MNKQILCVAGALVSIASSIASADLVSVEIVKGPFQHPDGLHDTWRVVAFFDDPMDRLNVVDGLQLSPVWFYTGFGELYNQEFFAGMPFNDFPSVGLGDDAEAYDSYMTIGATEFPSNIQFTPDFLGDWGKAPPSVQVILGSEFGPQADGGWFYFTYGGNEAPEVGMWNNEVVIAQFTIDKGAGFYLRTGIGWIDPVDGQMWTPFAVNNLPCPWDLDSSGSVSTSDLLSLFAQWGTAGPGDFDGSGSVDTSDLLILFANWGPCP